MLVSRHDVVTLVRSGASCVSPSIRPAVRHATPRRCLQRLWGLCVGWPASTRTHGPLPPRGKGWRNADEDARNVGGMDCRSGSDRDAGGDAARRVGDAAQGTYGAGSDVWGSGRPVGYGAARARWIAAIIWP